MPLRRRLFGKVPRACRPRPWSPRCRLRDVSRYPLTEGGAALQL